MRTKALVLAAAVVGCGGGGDGGGGDGGGGGGDSIPEVTVECSTDACAGAAGGNIVFFAYFPGEQCSTARSNPTSLTEAAGRGATYACAGGACTASSDDSPSAWDDSGDNDVTEIQAGNYAVVAWFDHTGDLQSGTGPNAGDTICCLASDIGANTSSVNLLSAGCVDL